MELIVVLAAAVPIIALLAAIWRVIRRLRPRAAALRVERERLESIVAGHRDMAESHATTAAELFHEQRAGESEDERGRI